MAQLPLTARLRSRLGLRLAATVFGIGLAVGLPGHADATVTFSGSGVGPGGVPVAASAAFTITGDTLKIVLRNTSASNNLQDTSGSSLSGLFFSLNATLSPVSATASAIIGTPCDQLGCAAQGNNVGGEFGYQANPTNPNNPLAKHGIASSGYLTTGLPGNLGNFGGINLDDPGSLDGANYVIVSAAAGFNPNGGLANDPLVQDQVEFIFNGVSGLSESAIGNITFQYGTAYSELSIPGNPPCAPGTPGCGGGGSNPEPDPIPEPMSLALLGTGLLGLGIIRRRRR